MSGSKIERQRKSVSVNERLRDLEWKRDRETKIKRRDT